MPRGIARPEPPLADDLIRLEPLTGSAHAGDMLSLTGDPDVIRFTRVPARADAKFVTAWLDRYEAGWEDGGRAGFAIRATADGEFLGFAALVHVDLEALETEIGYMVTPAARGRGVATRAVDLLTRWSFDELGLERVELRIDVENPGSVKVAERCGYRLDGVLRSVHVKEGLRADVGIWSRLKQD